MEWHGEEGEQGSAATGKTSPFVRGATAAAAAVIVYSLMDFIEGEPIELVKYSVLGLVVFSVIVAQEKLSKQSYR